MSRCGSVDQVRRLTCDQPEDHPPVHSGWHPAGYRTSWSDPVEEDEPTTVKRLLDEALQYSEHDPGCHAWRDSDCTCGLYQLLVRAGVYLGWHT